MKSRINQSDLKKLLHFFAPSNYQLFIFDPLDRLHEDQALSTKDAGANAPKILINLSNEVCRFKDLQIEDFDMIFDFGKSKVSDSFRTKQLEYVKNPDQTIRWIFSKGQIKTALNFYNQSTFRSKLLAKGFVMMNKLRLGSFFNQGRLTVHYKESLKIESALKSVSFDDYAIFTGTVGFGRTAVVALSKNKVVTHFAKIAYCMQGRELMENERMHLKTQQVNPFSYIVVPKVVDQNDPNILITTNVTLKKTKRSNKFLAAHSHFVASLFHKTRLAHKIANTDFWDAILNNISYIDQKEVQPELKRLAHFVAQAKQNINPNKTVLTTLSHSDFTPWNLKYDQDNIYVYDWEYARFQTPALFDLIHFHFQNGLFVKHQNFEQIFKDISLACQEVEIKYIIDQYKIDIEFYTKLYLLKTVSFQLGNMMHQDSFSKMDLKKIALYESALSTLVLRTTEEVHRAVFIKEFYEELRRTPHAMLKFVAGSFTKLAPRSDLDIAVLKQDIPAIIRYAKNHLLVNKTRVIKKSYMTVVELFFKDGSFLSIDLINQFKRKGLEMMSLEPLLISARPNNAGIMVPDKRFDLEYAYLFYTLNGAELPIKYYQYFNAPNLSVNHVFKYINEKYDLNMACYEDLYKTTESKLAKVRKIVAEQDFQTILNRVGNLINYWKDTVKGILHNKGFIITMSGVDGAGKSTIIGLVHEQIQSQFRKEVVLLRHRPAVLPILSSIKYGSPKQAEKQASERMPRTGTNHNKLSSAIRFAYYYTDYIIGQVYVYFKYIIREKIVLYDRYYFDFIADCERSNIRLNKNMIKALYVFVSKPKLNVLLWADANEIYARKQELEPATITKLTHDYKRLFKSYKRRYKNSTYKVIKNVNLDFTVNSIMRAFANAI